MVQPSAVLAAIAPVTVATPQSDAVLPASVPIQVPVGTRMAQIGAYATRDLAEQAWQRLSAKYGAYLAGKHHVIQTGQNDGVEFHRLRLIGFRDRNDAKSYCDYFIARNIDCFPTVMK